MDLRAEFQNKEYRYGYVESSLDMWIATQIVVLRQQRGLTQAQLAELIGTKQSAIARLENCNYSAWNVQTLKKIAQALGVRLHISFESFGSFIEERDNFSREFLQRPAFDDDPEFAPTPAPAGGVQEATQHQRGQGSEER